MAGVNRFEAIAEAAADWLRPKRRRPRKVRVPNVMGRAVSEAELALMAAGLKFDFEQVDRNPPAVMGTVVGQEPAPDTVVRRGTVVMISAIHPRRPGPEALGP